MNKTIALLGLLLATLGFSAPAVSVTLSLLPVSQTIDINTSANVDLFVSGLGDLSAPSLGAFNVDIVFDDSVLSFTSVSFGTALGFSVQGVDHSVPGVLSLDEISLESVAFLDGTQAGDFRLATLTFNGHHKGTSPLGFATFVLGDADGQVLSNVSLVPSSIEVVVPLPAAAWLFSSGLLVLPGLRRRG